MLLKDSTFLLSSYRVPLLMESLKAGNRIDLFLFEDMNQRGAEVWEIDHIMGYVKRFQAYRISVSSLFLQCLFLSRFSRCKIQLLYFAAKHILE